MLLLEGVSTDTLIEKNLENNAVAPNVFYQRHEMMWRGESLTNFLSFIHHRGQRPHRAHSQMLPQKVRIHA